MSSQSESESREPEDRRGQDRRIDETSGEGPERRKNQRRSGLDRRQTRRSA